MPTTRRRPLSAVAALVAALALLAACGGDGGGAGEAVTPADAADELRTAAGDTVDEAGDVDPEWSGDDQAIGAAERDEVLAAAATAHLLRSGVLIPGTEGVVLLAGGQCATGSIWLRSDAHALGVTLAEIAGGDEEGVVDASGTLLVEVASTGGDASQPDCLRALERALAGFDATRVG